MISPGYDRDDMRVRLLFAIVIGLLAAPCPAPAQDAAWPLYRNEKFGFEFRYPPAFVAGAYRDELPADLKAQLRRDGGALPFEHAVALVERTRLGGRTLTALPVGEITAVTVEPVEGPKLAAVSGLLRQIYKEAVREVTIGAHRVLRAPGFPGPYGDAAFFYLVPIAEGRALELYAHRQFLEPPRGSTAYDRVIEQIIATLRFFPPRP
jgi:hypothetical protein